MTTVMISNSTAAVSRSLRRCALSSSAVHQSTATSLVSRSFGASFLAYKDVKDAARFKSSIAASNDAAGNDSKCPFTGGSKHPELVDVPKLPFFGSRISSFSGAPEFAISKFYEHTRKMQEKFGYFYRHGVPGMGEGIFGTLYVISSPEEMLKVIRSEGKFPSGGIQRMWPIAKLMKSYGSPLVNSTTGDLGMLGQGEGWKVQRTFFQTGMLDPRAARMYVPGISEAAALASKGAPDASRRNDMNYYLNLCAFDMFCTFMFGELTRCADRSLPSPSTEQLDENNVFCQKAIASTEEMMRLAMSPKEILANQLGFETSLFKTYQQNWMTVREIGLKKLTAFAKRHEAGELSELERNSYFALALDRWKDDESISHDLMMELAVFALAAGVDTTSGVTGWNLIHIAMNRRVQQTLYDELSSAVAQTGGEITDKTLEKKMVPYLHACLKENYRLTPPFPPVVTKTVSQATDGVDIHGMNLPKGSIVALHPKFNPPGLSDANEFKPERWMPDAVESRKGTPLEEMDHAIFRDRFGQGARRCPGSRVATNEVMAILAHLVLDFEIEIPPECGYKTWEDVPYTISALLYPKIPPLIFTPRSEPSAAEMA